MKARRIVEKLLEGIGDPGYKETVLYGRKIGAEEWQEELLSTVPAQFERVKELATKDGYGHFREATADLSAPPDFAATVRRPVRRRK